jgi:tripartite-type tricarboxylate transporter receptor subunit TctC
VSLEGSIEKEELMNQHHHRSKDLSPSMIVLFLLFAVGTLVSGVPGIASGAEKYPSKPISYVIFWPPGGRTDLSARMVTPYIKKHLNTPVTVINEAGGAGIIGHKMIKEADPDGYSIAQSGGTVALQYTKSGIHMWDYTWIANIYATPFVVAVPTSSPFKTLKALVDFGKANPKKLRAGNSGIGNTPHLGTVSFSRAVGIDLTHVPYKGEGPSVVGLASGEIDLMLGMMSAFHQMVDAGKLRLLGICGPERMKNLYANLPTVKDETGSDFAWETWEGIFGPKGLKDNKQVLSILSEGIRKAIQDAEFVEKLASIGLDARYRGGEEFDHWLREHDKEMNRLTQELGMQRK